MFPVNAFLGGRPRADSSPAPKTAAPASIELRGDGVVARRLTE
jgi:hypothetical protein